MARASFGGGVADFVVSAAAPGDPLRFASATLTMWSAETGGTRYTDLLWGGSPVTAIPVGVDGQVPTFQGPDEVLVMWAQAGESGGRVMLDASGDIALRAGAAVEQAEIARDDAVAAKEAAEAVGATADAQMTAIASNPASAFAQQQSASYARGGISVLKHGAVAGTDCTAAFTAAFAAQASTGRPVFVPDGDWTLEGVPVTGKTTLRLSSGARLLHKVGTTQPMFNLTGTSLRIIGGTIDGQQASQTTRNLSITVGEVESGKSVIYSGVEFANCMRATLDATLFGGFISITDCRFTGQAEHDGTLGHHTMIARVGSGQSGAKGFFRFNRNTAIGTATPALAGGNPGGIFFACNGYDLTGGGGSGSAGFAVGNLSTFEGIGNHFYGYGQNCGGNDIAPFHFYPAVAGARIVGNYFEACGFSAIAAKSVQDFVCTGNVILNGLTSAQNVATEGAISYVPGYQASSTVRPRAVISSNIVTSPGGESATVQQVCINVGGQPTSYASDVIVADNVCSGGGVGIRVDQANDVTISGNIVNGGTASVTGGDHALQVVNAHGDVMITGNQLTASGGQVIHANTGNSTGRFHVLSNAITQTSASYYGANMRGMAFLKFAGNTFDCAGTISSITADASANKVGWLAWDASNTVRAGTFAATWANVTKATGQLADSGTPATAGVVPGEVGTHYRQTNGSGDSVLWVANGLTSADWVKVLSVAVAPAGPPAVLGMRGWNFDPLMATVAQTAQAAGVLDVSRVLLTGGGVITSVVVHVSTAGTSLTAGQCLIGVYDSSGNLIGQSADLSGVLNSTGAKTINLVTPTSSLTPGAMVDVALLWNGTGTAPGLRGFNGASMQPNIGIAATADYRRASAGSALTDLPSTMPTKTAVTNSAPFVGVK